jgi:putative membrane protein
MTRLVTAFVAIFVLAGLQSAAQAQFFGAPDAQTFAQKAAAGGQFEIQSSQLALQKSKNDAVRQFAQRMIKDHTELADKLRTALEKAKMPEPQLKFSGQEQRMLTQLRGAEDAKFLWLFINDQVQAHKGAVKLLRRYAKRGKNADLKQFASEALPVVQQHLQLAQDLKRTALPALTRYTR